MAGERVEKFAPSGGQLTNVLGIVVGALLILAWVVDRDEVPPWLPALGVLLVVLVWTTSLRPRVWVEPGTLVMRNMLDTVHIPLAAVEEVAVRQVMAVRVAGRRYVCSGTGRTLRQALKGSAINRARAELGGLAGHLAQQEQRIEPGMNYGDYVELRLRDLISEDRARRGLRAYSDELDALAADVRRIRAWPEVAALVGALALLALALLVG